MGETALFWTMAFSSLASAGTSIYSTTEQIKAGRKAFKANKAAIAKATADATAERTRIDNLEKERLERLRKRGAQLPPSLLTQGLSGATGSPSTLKPTLG